jgi:hypothetical protein
LQQVDGMNQNAVGASLPLSVSMPVLAAMRCALNLCAAVMFLAGCSRQAIDFNNQVAEVHARLGRATLEFGQVLRPIKEGQPPTADDFGQAAGRLRSELAAVKELSDSLQVPELPHAAELYAAHQEFLEAQRSLLERELVEFQRLLGGGELAVHELATRLQARLTALRANETPALDRLHAAQRRFAEANGLKLTKPVE